MNSLSTWWRYRRMELRYAFYQTLEALEWPIRLVLNWLIFMTLWAWVGFVYMGLVLHRAITIRKSGERDALTGKIWWWKQYKLW